MKTQRTRDDELAYLKDYLVRNGIEPFWANSALDWVRRVMAGNTHWVTDLKCPRVLHSKDFTGVIRRLTVRCTLHSVSADAPGKIVYTFRPGKGGHRVEIKAV
jgi:hypothetical protein